MCNMIQTQQLKMTNSSENSSGNQNVETLPFSALHFLRAYNRLLSPSEISQCYNLTPPTSGNFSTVPQLQNLTPLPPLETILPVHQPINGNSKSPSEFSSNSSISVSSPVFDNKVESCPTRESILMPSTSSAIPLINNGAALLPAIAHPNGMLLNSSHKGFLCSSLIRRQRGEKRPIPEELKDEKYFERRKRNNEAAKKSRDARKIREDRIALRAALLEQENSILRAQTMALREEVCTLRQILCSAAPSTNRASNSQLTSL